MMSRKALYCGCCLTEIREKALQTRTFHKRWQEMWRSTHVQARPHVAIVGPGIDDQIVDASRILRRHLRSCGLQSRSGRRSCAPADATTHEDGRNSRRVRVKQIASVEVSGSCQSKMLEQARPASPSNRTCLTGTQRDKWCAARFALVPGL